MISIKMTQAQVSALQCGCWDDEPILVAAWKNQGSELVWNPDDTDELLGAIGDGSNSEDAVAEDRNADPVARRQARGAALALSNLSTKVFAEHEAYCATLCRSCYEREADDRVNGKLICNECRPASHWPKNWEAD